MNLNYRNCSLKQVIFQLSNKENQREKVIYFGIGSFVKEKASCDQQIPKFIRNLAVKENIPVKIWLFDPNFQNYIPLIIEIEKDKWKLIEDGVFQCGNIELCCSSHVIDEDSPLLSIIETYILEKLQMKSHVFLGVFAVPYLMVPENKEIVSLFHRIQFQVQNERNFYYFHLADYATKEDGTKVWLIKGSEFNQDEAVMKEVIRFGNDGFEGPTFGVSSYVLNPGKKFRLAPKHSNQVVDYSYLQSQVNQAIASLANLEEFLNKDEVDINKIIWDE